jgi:hypothetical protein
MSTTNSMLALDGIFVQLNLMKLGGDCQVIISEFQRVPRSQDLKIQKSPVKDNTFIIGMVGSVRTKLLL